MMADAGVTHKLKHLAPADIRPNPENPRLIFRQEEMEILLRSIDKHGIQVPITVYQDGDFYTLIDGERRWRCATKLNLKSIPAIIQSEPSELENLVLMYNIHSLREQWDYYTIASKLARISDLYEIENYIKPNEVILSELTGLTRAAIRRCQLLIDLPDRFKDMLRDELDKPKSQQRLTEDFFIEMERSLKTVTARLPEFAPQRDAIRDTLITKFRAKTIPAVTDFRQLSKIATAVQGLGLAEKTARRALERVFTPADRMGIREAYTSTVEFEYIERRASKQAEALVEFLTDVVQDDRLSDLEEELRRHLIELHGLLETMLEA